MRSLLVSTVLAITGCSSPDRTIVEVSDTELIAYRYDGERLGDCGEPTPSALLAVGECASYSDIAGCPPNPAGIDGHVERDGVVLGTLGPHGATSTWLEGNFLGADLVLGDIRVTLPTSVPPRPTVEVVPGQPLRWTVATPAQASASVVTLGGFACRVDEAVKAIDAVVPSSTFSFGDVTSEIDVRHDDTLIVRAVQRVSWMSQGF